MISTRILLLPALILLPAMAWAQPVLNPANGHHYDVITGSRTWSQAAADAESRSFGGAPGHLATITSPEENDFLKNQMNIPSEAWIGAFQPPGTGEPNSGWSWITKEKWAGDSWAPSEPNNAGGNEDCGQWWTPDGTWNDRNCASAMPTYVIEYETAEGETRATFEVVKVFTDGNPSPVEVTLSCNTGLPIEQTKEITTAQGVEFVVVDFDAGEMDCDVTEEVPDGYEVEYFDNGFGQGFSGNSTACEYDDIGDGWTVRCVVQNHPGPVEVEITKTWVLDLNENAPLNGVGTEYRIDLRCTGPIESVSAGGDFNNYNEDSGHAWWSADTSSDRTFTATVTPNDYLADSCEVDESVYDSAVEVDNDCGEFDIDVGGGPYECTITNTVFFEGIPTLSQYGLAMLALLLLGVGFVGFRRFA